MGIKENLESLEIKNATLVAVTKKVPVERILEAIENGVKDIGENYVREAESKFEAIGKKVRWHLIGNLQGNKVKKAVKIFDVIQTIDSYGLAEKIDAECGKIKKKMDVLIQVDLTGDKHGISPDELLKMVDKLKTMKNIELKGLMGIASIENPASDFRNLKRLFDKTGLKILSMGMSNDYKIALSEGSNMVRIGTAIFGLRH